MHLIHHKYTNIPEKDPDYWAGQGPYYMLPLRWMSIEIKYYTYYIPIIFQRPRKEALSMIVHLSLMIIVALTLCALGFSKSVLWAWIIPGRMALWALSFCFDYLPHRPHNISRYDDVYAATSVTSLYGEATFWLTWPLLHQNYHNIHHLAPYVPFYLYSTVWHGLKDELKEKGTKIKPIFR
jgi:fatty acid desaturase